ncbi:MAG: protein-tyrosine-phosphatase, partial [Microvirga sp.]
MQSSSISLLTICGISELPDQRERAVTHVLSILDPD